MTWPGADPDFIETVLEKIHAALERAKAGKMTNLSIKFGRKDERGGILPPRIDFQTFD